MIARERARAVVDTNVLVRGVLRPRGLGGRVLRSHQRRRFALVTSPALLRELSEALLGPDVARVADMREAYVAEFVAKLGQTSDVVAGDYRDVVVVPDDPADNVLFACALEGRANYIVSGDEAHVRAVKLWKPYEVAIQVVSPAYFVRAVLGLPPPHRR